MKVLTIIRQLEEVVPRRQITTMVETLPLGPEVLPPLVLPLSMLCAESRT